MHLELCSSTALFLPHSDHRSVGVLMWVCGTGRDPLTSPDVGIHCMFNNY